MSVHSLKQGKSVREQVSKEEWEKRVEWPARLKKLDRIDPSFRE